jgi:glycosyltransferase involved in cell wall biosynthesis
LRIAILGTKGIPNRYGGFEQFAEYLSKGLAVKGHEITVYSPHFHVYQQKELDGVKIRHVYCPENLLGGGAHFIYDYLCIKDALNQGFDIIYEAGYASCAHALRYFKKRSRKMPVVVTNMDGMEWKRSKWNAAVQNITKRAEALAVAYSDYLVADNLGIQKYFSAQYGKDSVYLPYGAEVVTDFKPEILEKYHVKPFSFFMIIARLEPENNIEKILQGYIESKSDLPFIVIGGLSTKHAKDLVRYQQLNKNLRFVGGVYDIEELNTLRRYCAIYFHGHSVGGTNPSLLEAMGCGSFIAAHNNEFNRSVIGENGLFFTSPADVAHAITEQANYSPGTRQKFLERNQQEIKEKYEWRGIIDLHEDFFHSILQKQKASHH